jgi:hypothetical protein
VHYKRAGDWLELEKIRRHATSDKEMYDMPFSLESLRVMLKAATGEAMDGFGQSSGERK